MTIEIGRGVGCNLQMTAVSKAAGHDQRPSSICEGGLRRLRIEGENVASVRSFLIDSKDIAAFERHPNAIILYHDLRVRIR
jgi:hypothetical protein